MQKIEGENLQDWMSQRNNRPIGEKKARLWLEELVHILSDLHKNLLFHGDIKKYVIIYISSYFITQ